MIAEPSDAQKEQISAAGCTLLVRPQGYIIAKADRRTWVSQGNIVTERSVLEKLAKEIWNTDAKFLFGVKVINARLNFCISAGSNMSDAVATSLT